MLFIKGYPAGLNSVVMWMVAVRPASSSFSFNTAN